MPREAGTACLVNVLGPPLELPAIEPQHLRKEADRPLRCCQIPFEPALGPLHKITQMPIRRRPHIRPGHNFTGLNRLRPGCHRILSG